MDNYDYNALANEVVRRGINMFESFDDWTKGLLLSPILGGMGSTFLRPSAVSVRNTMLLSASESSEMHLVQATVLELPPLYICVSNMALIPISIM